MEIKPVELVGARVKVVPMEASHTQALFEAGCHPDIWTYLPRPIETLEDMRGLVMDALEAKGQGIQFPFVIIDKNANQVVGSTRFLEISLPNRNLEIGWTWLSPGVWRTRINTECKYLLLKHCFEALRTIRVQLKTDARNVRSQTAIERLGAIKEGVIRNHRILRDGRYRDSVYYSIIDTEWTGVKARLEAFLQR